MRISNDQIARELQKLNLHNENNYLRIILDSYIIYNHRARLDVADTLYQKFLTLTDSLEDNNLKRNIIGEIYSKLMQVIEDSALLAIMFTTKGKSPVEVFGNINTSDLYRFFGKSKRGLSDKEILKILGLKPAKDLLSEDLITKNEFKDFEKQIDSLINGSNDLLGEKERWKKLGRLYTGEYRVPSVGSYKIRYTSSGAVSAYYNLKHNFKVLLPTEIFKKIWPVKDGKLNLNIVEEYKPLSKLFKKIPKGFEPYKDKNLFVIGELEVSKEALEELFERIHPNSQEIKIIAECQLKLLDDPTYVVRDIRFIIYQNKKLGKPLPKKCPCRSGKKYRNCHGSKNYIDNDLIYNKLRYEPIIPPRTRLLGGE